MTRKYLLLPLIPGPRIVVEDNVLVEYRLFGQPKRVPLNGIGVQAQRGGLSLRGLINLITGCGNVELTGSQVGGSYTLRNAYGINRLQTALAGQIPRGASGEARSFAHEQLQRAEQEGRADFGPMALAASRIPDEPVSVNTPNGRWVLNDDGTATDVENGLVWIRAPWGMQWNGTSFSGNSIDLPWFTASSLFGRGAAYVKGLDDGKCNLSLDDIQATEASLGYRRGTCRVYFAGYDDWRLPTVAEWSVARDSGWELLARVLDRSACGTRFFWTASGRWKQTFLFWTYYSAWQSNFHQLGGFIDNSEEPAPVMFVRKL